MTVVPAFANFAFLMCIKLHKAGRGRSRFAVLTLAAGGVRWCEWRGFCELTHLLDDWDHLDLTTGDFNVRPICTGVTPALSLRCADQGFAAQDADYVSAGDAQLYTVSGAPAG